MVWEDTRSNMSPLPPAHLQSVQYRPTCKGMQVIPTMTRVSHAVRAEGHPHRCIGVEVPLRQFGKSFFSAAICFAKQHCRFAARFPNLHKLGAVARHWHLAFSKHPR